MLNHGEKTGVGMGSLQMGDQRSTSANPTERMSIIAEDFRTFDNLGNVYGYNIECSDIYGKKYSTMQNVIKKWRKFLTLKQMFDIIAETIHNDESINCLDKKSCIRGILGHNCHWFCDPVIIGFWSTKVYVFSESVLCLGKVFQHFECNEVWKNRVAGVRAERRCRDCDVINGESTEFVWNIFPGFTTLQFCDKIGDLLSSMGHTRIFHRNSVCVNVQWHFFLTDTTTKMNV